MHSQENDFQVKRYFSFIHGCKMIFCGKQCCMDVSRIMIDYFVSFYTCSTMVLFSDYRLSINVIMFHVCHKLWTKFCEIRQNFMGDLTKFCEVFFNITLELPQYSLKSFFLHARSMWQPQQFVINVFLHKICGKIVWKFCEIRIFYGNRLPDGPNSVRFYLTVWDMACMMFLFVVVVFLVFWLQILLSPFLFIKAVVSIHVWLGCFINKVEDPCADRTYVCNLELHRESKERFKFPPSPEDCCRFSCFHASVFICEVYHYLYLISPSFGVSGILCFVIVAFPEYFT